MRKEKAFQKLALNWDISRFLKSFYFAVGFAAGGGFLLFLMIRLVPSHAPQENESSKPCTIEDRVLLTLREIHLKTLRGNVEEGLKLLGPALAIYLADKCFMERIRFDGPTVVQLRREKKLMNPEARLLYRTSEMVEQAKHQKYPAQANFNGILRNLYKLVRGRKEKLSVK